MQIPFLESIGSESIGSRLVFQPFLIGQADPRRKDTKPLISKEIGVSSFMACPFGGWVVGLTRCRHRCLPSRNRSLNKFRGCRIKEKRDCPLFISRAITIHFAAALFSRSVTSGAALPMHRCLAPARDPGRCHPKRPGHSAIPGG